MHCQWDDAQDCGGDPYASCPTPGECLQSYKNGQCDVACNKRECLYDGGDCLPQRTCVNREACLAVQGDGQCQLDCLTLLCPYDFVDCGTKSSPTLVSCHGSWLAWLPWSSFCV